MPEPDTAPDPGDGGHRGVPRFRRPAPLLFEPGAPAGDAEKFFGLEELEEPAELLERSTELALAFRAAADRAVEFQAMAAARLADPARLEVLSAAAIADRGQWSEDYAHRMIEFGRELLARRPGD